jgi:aromatic ring-opening dioxygenase LigB subunit
VTEAIEIEETNKIKEGKYLFIIELTEMNIETIITEIITITPHVIIITNEIKIIIEVIINANNTTMQSKTKERQDKFMKDKEYKNKRYKNKNKS